MANLERLGGGKACPRDFENNINYLNNLLLWAEILVSAFLADFFELRIRTGCEGLILNRFTIYIYLFI